MKVKLMNHFIIMRKNFPMNPFQLQDTLDQLHVLPGDTKVTFEFEDNYDQLLPSNLSDWTFSADIFRLNLFIDRLQHMDTAENTAFKSVVYRHKFMDFDDILKMTFGLDSVPTWETECFAELGTIGIEQALLPEVQDCPPDLRQYLDENAIGELMADRGGGVFIEGYYCEPDKYITPDIEIQIARPEKSFFRLLIGPDARENALEKQLAGWISLPCSRTELHEFLTSYCSETKKPHCYDYQSALPDLPKAVITDIGNIDKLNAIAHRLAALTPQIIVKLKAVMLTEPIRTIEDMDTCLNRLNAYEFDVVTDRSDFGRKYLSRNLPDNFDMKAFRYANLSDIGDIILKEKQAVMTVYGALSVSGQPLYTRLEKEISDAPAEDETEVDDIEMGGISQ